MRRMGPVSKIDGYDFTVAVAVMAAAVCMVLPFVPIGYAGSYTSETVNYGNSLEASYFIVGLYTYTGDSPSDVMEGYSSISSQFTPADIFITTDAKFSLSNGKLSGTDVVVTPQDLYLVIVPVGDAETATYSIGDFGVTVTAGTDEVPSANVTSSVAVGNPSSPVSSLSADTAYRLTVTVTVAETQITGNSVTCDMGITSIIANMMNGTYVIHGCDIGLSTCDDVIDEIIDINTGEGGSTNVDLTPSDNDYGENPGINIAHDGNEYGGIVEGGNSGNINATLKVPAGTSFVISMYGPVCDRNQGARVIISDEAGHSYTGTVNIPRNTSTGNNQFQTYFYLPVSGGSFSSGTSLPGSDSAWITMSGTVTINIEKDAGNNKLAQTTKLDLVIHV